MIDNQTINIFAEDLRAFIHTDLLYYFADSPPELAEEQRKRWEPVLAWAETRYGITLIRTEGVMPIHQPDATVAALKKVLESDKARIEPLYRCTRALGSLVLALAISENRLSATDAFRLSRLDEDFQKRAWGADEEAEAREKAILQEVERIALTLQQKGS